MENSIEKFQKVINLVESLFKISVYVVILFIILTISPRVYDFYTKSDIKEINISGIKMTLNETKNTVQKTLNAIDNKKDVSDSLPNQFQQELGKNLNELNKEINKIDNTKSTLSGWIFGGSLASDHNSWETKYFNFDKIEVNKEYISNKALAVRVSAPFIVDGHWQKGNVSGLLLVNEKFTVLETKEIPGTHNTKRVWVRISQKI
jgi:hypothetical protein